VERHEILRAYVAKQGLKFTRQREMIAEAFFKSKGHLSVEELLQIVREIDPQVSLATVYRTMKLLTECGLAAAHHFGDGFTRYEVADSEDEHHDHLICTSCGKIVEFYNEDIEALQNQIAASYSFNVRHHKMELYGLCKKCQKLEHGS
jgi:Fur family ferric uptake transcriptional regulator